MAESWKKHAEMYGVLSDETRLRLMAELAKGPLNVSALCTKLKLAQPTVSHHLGLLRVHGLVESSRSGKQITYTSRSKIVGDFLSSQSLLLGSK